MLRLRSEDGRIWLWWRLLGYIVLLLVVLIGSELGRQAFRDSGLPLVLANLVGALLAIGGVLGLTVWFRGRLDRRSWAGMAFPAPHRHLGQLGVGLALGGAMIALVFVVQYLVGGIYITGFGITGGVSAGAVLLAAFLRNLATGVTEELSMRGYVFANLLERYPLWQAVIWNGVIFGALHFSQVNTPMQWGLLILSATIVSIFLVLCRLATGSLWLAIGWHTAWNWVQGPVLGLGGGAALIHIERSASEVVVGTDLMPELGLTTILVEGLGLLLILAWARRKGRKHDHIA